MARTIRIIGHTDPGGRNPGERTNMPKFIDFPREIRDMIYVEALVSDQVLVAKDECGGYPNNQYGSDDDFQHSDPTSALLQVNTTINSEAAAIFFGTNTFKLSPQPGLGRPSIFTRYATLFRSVVLELFNQYSVKYWAGEVLDFGTYEDLIQIWRDQIRALAAVANLRFLELNIRGVLVQADSVSATLGDIIWGLKPQLLANVPCSVRQKKGDRGSGVCLTISVDDSYMQHVYEINEFLRRLGTKGFDSEDMHKVGECWRELGINFQPDDALYPLESFSGVANLRSCYYG